MLTPSTTLALVLCSTTSYSLHWLELPFDALGQAAGAASAAVGKGSIAEGNNILSVDCCDVPAQNSNCSLFARVGCPAQCVGLDSVYQQTMSDCYAVQQNHSKQ